MFDFATEIKKHEYHYLGAEQHLMGTHLSEMSDKILNSLKDGKNNKFRLGGYLVDLYQSHCYAVTAPKYDWMGNIGNYSPTIFFHYCEDTFDLDKSQVSRLMNVVDEFGSCVPNGHGGEVFVCQQKYRNYSYSLLAEMLPLSPEQREAVKENWTVSQLREYRKKLVATSQQDEKSAEAEEKPEDEFSRFDKWKRLDFCRKIVELEEENESLRNALDEARRVNAYSA